MDEYTKKAILSAIRFEKASHDFYLLAASKATEPETRAFLMKLAREEFEHLVGFIMLYPGGERNFSVMRNDVLGSDDLGSRELLAKIDSIDSRKEALAIAVKEEQVCIELYSTFVDTIRNTKIHAMFSKALYETRQHLETIEAEYARCMGMINSSELDKYMRE